MPKNAGKRKEVDVTAALGGNDSDSEDDTAKQAFLKKYKQPPTQMHTVRVGGGATPKLVLEGVVVKADVVSRGGTPKLECEIDVRSVRINGAKDALVSGVKGIEYLLPSHVDAKAGQPTAGTDDSPEGGGKKSGGGGKKMALPRTLALAPNHKTIWLGSIPRVGFFTTPKGGAGAGAGAAPEKESTKLIVPGMLVEVQGVVANLDDRGQLWLNASSCEPRHDGIPDGAEAEHIMGYMAMPDVMAKNALLWSQTMGGFFGTKASDCSAAVAAQTAHFKDQWTQARDGLAASCDAKAMALRAEQGPDGEPAACVMSDHAIRLRAEDAGKFALGAPFFNDKMPPSPEYPTFRGGLVHDLVGMDYPQHRLLYGLFDKGSRAALPETYVAPEVHGVKVTGAVVETNLKLTFIGSKAAAIDSIKTQKEDPTGASSGTLAAAAFKVNMRKEVPINLGVLHEAKVNDLIVDVMTYGKWTVVAGIVPRDPQDTSIMAPWGTWVPNMPRTIPEIAMLVDESWVKEHLAGGANQYAFEQDPDVAVLMEKDEITPITIPPLSLKKNGYQEITGATFKFASAKMPMDRPNKEYRIWFKGATEAIKDDSDLLTNAAAGKKQVAAAAAACTPSLSVAEFILQRACIYVVAV